MTVQLKRWGNSIALRIPDMVVKLYHLEEGQSVDMETDDLGIHLHTGSVLDELIASVPDEQGIDLHEGMAVIMREEGNPLYS